MSKIPNSASVSLALVTLWAASAAAQQPTRSLRADRPWARHVSQEHQSSATQLFEEGNSLLNDLLFPDAEKKYIEALAHWEHPAIHYNMALALPPTLRPTEVYDHLQAATEHGEDPLGPERFRYARSLTERMKKEYAWVVISCDCEASATLASGRWLVRRSNGRFEGLVPPGTHTLIATPKGHPTTEITLTLAAGQQTHFHLDAKRPWAVWKPWAIVGAGATAAAGGLLLNMKAQTHLRAFDEAIEDCHSPGSPRGCFPDSSLAQQRSRGLKLQRLSIAAYAVGGAAFFTGLVLAYTNQVQTQLTPMSQSGSRLVIAPMLGGKDDGILVTLRF
jgi:hypothetical protein